MKTGGSGNGHDGCGQQRDGDPPPGLGGDAPPLDPEPDAGQGATTGHGPPVDAGVDAPLRQGAQARADEIGGCGHHEQAHHLLEQHAARTGSRQCPDPGRTNGQDQIGQAHSRADRGKNVPFDLPMGNDLFA